MNKLLSDYNKNSVTNINDFYPSNLNNEFIEGFNETVFNRFLTKPDFTRVVGAIGTEDLSSAIRNILEDSQFKTDNQLQPVLTAKVGAVSDFMTWQDFMRMLGQQDVDVENFDTWGDVTQFNWVPPIDLNKFINFRDYYWDSELHGQKQPDYVTIRNKTIERALRLQQFLKTVSDVRLEGAAVLSTTLTTANLFVASNVTSQYPVDSFVIVKFVDNTYELRKIVAATYIPMFSKTELTLDSVLTKEAVNVVKTTFACTRDALDANIITIFGGDYTQLLTVDYVFAVSSPLSATQQFNKVVSSEFDGTDTIVTLLDAVPLSTSTVSLSAVLQMAAYETTFETGITPIQTWDEDTLAKLIWLVRINKLTSVSGVTYRTEDKLTDVNADYILSDIAIGDTIKIQTPSNTAVYATVTNVVDANTLEFSTEDSAYIFSFSNLPYEIYTAKDTSDYFVEPLVPVLNDIWIDQDTDTVNVFDGAVWEIYVSKFSYLYDDIIERKLIIDQNPWSSTNAWIHKSQLSTVAGKLRAQLPIIEFNDTLSLADMSATTHDWSYRNTESNSFSSTTTPPTTFELFVIQKQEIADLEFTFSDVNTIVFASKYGNMTSYLKTGAVINLSGFALNNGNYSIATATYGQLTPTGSNVTSVTLSSPLNDVDDRPIYSKIQPSVTSLGDVFVSPYVNWRYDGVNNTFSTSITPEKNSMYTLVVTSDSDGVLEYKRGYNWQSFANVSAPVTNQELQLQPSLHTLCLYDDYQEGDIRVYINKVRQYGNFIELPSYLNDAYVGGIQFIDGTVVDVGDVVLIEVGEYATVDAGKRAIVVNTSSGYELTNLSSYKKLENIKTEFSQSPEFVVVDSFTKEPYITSSKIFSYVEDATKPLNPFILKKLAVSSSTQNTYLFNQHLKDGEKILGYQQQTITGNVYGSIWKVGSNFEKYVPSLNVENEWNIPNNWFYNAYHENRDQVAYTELYNHFRSIIQAQSQIGLPLDTVNAYFADNAINYGLGGTIKEHNSNLDLLMAAIFNNTTTVESLIGFAKNQYKNSLHAIENIFMDDIAQLFATESVDANSLVNSIVETVISTFENNSEYNFWFGDSSSYDGVDGVKNWILTLPKMGLTPPVKPYYVSDSVLGISELIHHDGHRSTVSLTPATREVLYARILADIDYARDIVTSDAQPFPNFIGVRPVVNGDYLLRTNTVAKTRILYRFNGLTWEAIPLVSVLVKCLLEVETRLYEIAIKNYEAVYDLASLVDNAKYATKFMQQFEQYIAESNIIDPMSNADRYSQNNPFTWNYYNTTPTTLPSIQTISPAADWRQLYTNAFGTPYPHLEPWIVQGYDIKPTWWDTVYLVDGEYTVAMWDNIFSGTIPPEGTPPDAIKIFTYLPVVTTLATTADGYVYGSLLPPYWNSANTGEARIRSIFDPNVGDEIITPAANFTFGQTGDMEYAWSISLDNLYDKLVVAFKLDPLKFFSAAFGPKKYTIGCLELHEHTRNIENASNTLFHGDTVDGELYVCNGLNQWYVNFNRYEGYAAKVSEFYTLWKQSEMKLSYVFGSMIDSSAFTITSPKFDLTQKDYSVDIKTTDNFKIHKLDSLNLTLMSIPSKFVGDVDTGWTMEVSTIPELKAPINYFNLQNYNVDINASVFTVMSYPLVGIDYQAAKNKLHLTLNNTLQLDDATNLDELTTYSFIIDVDATPYLIEVLGSDAQTIETLLEALNVEVAAFGYFDLYLGDVIFYSNGLVSNITLTDVDLFSSITNFNLYLAATMQTVDSIFERVIIVKGNYTSKFIRGDQFTVADSATMNGSYTVVSTSYNYSDDTTSISVLEDPTVALPNVVGTIDGIATLDKNIGIPSSWTTGTEVYLNTYGTLSGLDTERPYYIIRMYDVIGPDTVLNVNKFALALTADKAQANKAIDTSSVTYTGTLFVGKLERTFKALSGASSGINWRVYAVDDRTQSALYDGATFTGMQNIVDFLFGYSYYNESIGFDLNNINKDETTGRPNSWQLYVEKLIDWAFNARFTRQDSKPIYTVEARPSDSSFIFLDSGVPNWSAGTTVILEETTGATLPPEFTSSSNVTVPYYVVKTVSNTEIKLAANALDATRGNFITFSTPSTGKIFMQVFQKFENRPTFNFNPFKELLVVRQDIGLLANVFEDGNYIYATNGTKLNPSQLFISRRDKQTELSLLGITKDFNRLNEQNAIYIGGARLSTTTYEHILSFEDYSVGGNLIYDAFLGLKTLRFVTEFNRQTVKTLRPTVGGYVLHNNNLIENIESTIADSRYYYDTLKTVEGKDSTVRARKALGYDGPKDYMTDIGINTKSQFMFWKGAIQSKGTNFAVNAFTNQTGLNNAVVDEFWTYKVAEFGGTYKREYPEMKLLASDAARSELRIEFIPPNNTALDTTFEGIALTDSARWFDQPDQLAAMAPYDTFFFDTKVANIYTGMESNIQEIRGDKVLVITDAVDGVILSHTVGDTVEILVENSDYVFLNSYIIKFTTTTSPEDFVNLTVATLVCNFDAQNPSKIIDRQSGTVVSDVPFWNPILGQHYLKAFAVVDITSDTDPAKYNVKTNQSYSDANNIWMSEKVGTIWLDNKNQGYIPYNDRGIISSINDRIFNWGKLAEWANIELYQWTRSNLTPAEWDAESAKQANDYTIPDELKITGQTKKILYKKQLPETSTPVWTIDEDQHFDFIVGLLGEADLPPITGTVSLYVNGKYVYDRDVVDPLEYLALQESYPVGFYIHILKRAYVPTQAELATGLYVYSTPYVVEEQTNNVSGESANAYYYWVSNKTNKIISANSQYTLIGVKNAILYNPEPYMIVQGLRPTGSGYGLVYGNVFDEFAFDLPYRYTQLIIKGLEGTIRDDSRYTLRFTKDFNLRDKLNGLELKNVHEEWKLFREKQYNKIDRYLWNKLIEAVIGYKMVSDTQYDANETVPYLNRVVYDNIYGADTRIGLGEGQILLDGDVAKTTIMAVLTSPSSAIELDNIRTFVDTLDFTTPESSIVAMNAIYTTLTVTDVNKLFFELLHIVMSLKKEHKEIFKTSWVALQTSQNVDISANTSMYPEHNLATGTCSSIP